MGVVFLVETLGFSNHRDFVFNHNSTDFDFIWLVEMFFLYLVRSFHKGTYILQIE